MSFDEDRMDAEAQRRVRPGGIAPEDGYGLRNAMSALRGVQRAMSQLDGRTHGQELVELAEAARVLSTIIGNAIDEGSLRT
jgi:hypothetical protein